ncbi:MAG: hypothetical protein CM1200mP41_37910 [Gammaproteobacteria bacterium]|nr:MAG: hypothetical protein CM1200mP41_37910 [Gammaproteobacteria bacterium]
MWKTPVLLARFLKHLVMGEGGFKSSTGLWVYRVRVKGGYDGRGLDEHLPERRCSVLLGLAA